MNQFDVSAVQGRNDWVKFSRYVGALLNKAVSKLLLLCSSHLNTSSHRSVVAPLILFD
jgi:hypothetical protein